MKRDGWVISLAVIGIALLAAAVAFTPACDTGGGGGGTIDACEELTGSWTITSNLDENTCPWPARNSSERVDFEVIGGQVSMDFYEGEFLESSKDGTIACDGKEFDISWRNDPVPIPTSTVPDCEETFGLEISGTFGSGDEFSGTMAATAEYSGSDCGSFTDCVTNYDISAVRR